ncbi:hypothetical protein ACFSM5_16400 [Lacibacterium aquatile]|uniref:Uncharacterized protein n=1 Tax=Lacibacterium aquatile TaxID=1168082 RepID=A0ABW5DU96_9PROT
MLDLISVLLRAHFLLVIQALFSLIGTFVLLHRSSREVFAEIQRQKHPQDSSSRFANPNAYGWVGRQGRAEADMMLAEPKRVVVGLWLAWLAHALFVFLPPEYRFW